jgi:exopolysaccharide production protein ExoY
MTVHFDSVGEAAVSDTWDVGSARLHRTGLYRRYFKPALELMLVLVTLPIILPLIAVLCLPVLLRGGSPIYRQRRIGRGGHEFVMYKVRTMVPDADERLAHYLQENPEARAEWARKQKLTNDPRITPYGRFLRKTSLDELPQLINVLKGEMALIGPRPMMPHQRALYHGMSYFAMRPGMSGYWQVSDRNDCEFASRVYFDDLYDQTISLSTDIGLLLRTIRAVLRGTGV